MSYEYIQKPCLNVQRALETFGGWHKSFKGSMEILVTEKDPRFWDIWAATMMEEQLRKEVERCINEVRRRNRADKRSKDELKKQLEKALLDVGWKPNIPLIRREIRSLKREKKEQVLWLRQSMGKTAKAK